MANQNNFYNACQYGACLKCFLYIFLLIILTALFKTFCSLYSVHVHIVFIKKKLWILQSQCYGKMKTNVMQNINN